MSKFTTHTLSGSKKKIKDHKHTPDGPDTISAAKSIRIKKWILAILLIIVSLILVGTMSIRAIGNISLSGMNTGSVFTPIIPTNGSGILVEKIEGTKNILIAGIGGAGHEGSLLTDSIMLASINSDDGFVTLISIPRDLYVAYPKGYGKAGKINALYSLGVADKVGIKLLAEKVSEITGQSIEEYAVIDFRGFKNIVDALGGIEIDVPRELIDTAYPNNNWGYEILRVKAGLQTFDGDLALKYARSRHSTSDFDRSERQQLILKGLREKAFSLELLTDPKKIKNIFDAVVSHLDTSLTINEVTDIALRLEGIKSTNINIYTLNNECVGNTCTAGAYLYTPSREYFNGASVLMPENTGLNKLSYYDDIRRFTGFIFQYPDIRQASYPISVIAGKGKTSQAKNIIMTLGKLGIDFDDRKILTEATGSISTSHINIYWNEEMDIGISPSTSIVQGLKFLEEKIPYNIVIRNEYITTEGPRIEIVIGNDIASYFTFAKPAYYLPYLAPTASGSTGPQSASPIISGENKSNPKKIQKINIENTSEKNPNTTDDVNTTDDTGINNEVIVAPGEWEEF